MKIEKKFWSLFLGLVFVGMFAVAGGMLSGCGEEDTGGKSCTVREDCAPCEFCNMGTCRVDPACTVCASNADCPDGQVCNYNLGECEDAQSIDGDEVDKDDNVITPDGDESTGDLEDLSDVEDNIIPTDGDEELPDTTTDGDDDDFEVERIEGRELGDIEFEGTTQCQTSGNPGPEITTTPADELNFGAVMIGDWKLEYLTICNSGGQAFTITNILLTHDTSTAEFQIRNDPLPVTLNSGEGLVVAVIYQPLDNINDEGTLQIVSSADRPEVNIHLVGQVKPVGRLSVQPEILQFFFQGGTKVVRLANVGIADLAILQMRIEDPNQPAKFHLVQPTGNGPWPLAPNATMDVSVQFDGGEGSQDGTLHIVWNNGESNIESIVELQAGGDIQCAVPNAGPDQQVAPLAVVQLDGSASYDPNDVMQPGENWYFWDLTGRPQGALNSKICQTVTVDAANHQVICNNNVQGRWSNVANPQIYAEIAGTYTIMLKVNPHDDPGCENTMDTVQITAVPDETIHIQITWDKAGNDHDLHLVRYSTPSMMGQVGCFTRDNGDLFFPNVNDCMYSNCNTQNGTNPLCPPRGCPGPQNAPDWGMLNQRVDDPTLDIDDIQGVGPENINLSLPENGDYFVGVEYYSHGNSLEPPPEDQIPNVTAKIWLFGVLEYQKTNKITAGPKHHWNVAWIHVANETQITVEEIDVNNKLSADSNGDIPDCNPTQP